MGKVELDGILDIKDKIEWVLENYSNPDLFLVIEENIEKDDLLKKMVQNIKEKSDKILEENDFYENLLLREKTGNTSLGEGIALPHSRFKGVKSIVVSMALLKNGVESYNPIDEQPIKLVIMVGAPKEEGAEYLQLIAAIARMFLNDEYRKQVLNSQTHEEFVKNVGAFK